MNDKVKRLLAVEILFLFKWIGICLIVGATSFLGYAGAITGLNSKRERETAVQVGLSQMLLDSLNAKGKRGEEGNIYYQIERQEQITHELVSMHNQYARNYIDWDDAIEFAATAALGLFASALFIRYPFRGVVAVYRWASNTAKD